ncbi:response regulator transcription factor [Paraburkholderia sp.]|uniref:response regulator transcription factor n=1 Tax=Paraburkholderia sp. TaxID=1926495 RepID=UPI002386EA18|nr:response regulator transcription factor [Paraburkholderia sp.]MDE1182469.1 response regulator transcription factor [Paraburkholderia sp.]
MRILFVAAAHPEAVWLFRALQESAHSLQRADTLRDGIFLARQEPFDAVIVLSPDSASYADVHSSLPALCAAAGTSSTAAVLVVLGIANANDRTRMLRAGADACFCQPYSFREMHERMQALQRTLAARIHGESAHGVALSLDPLTRELVSAECRLSVTRREYLLIECLMRQMNAPVPRDQLIRYAWPESDEVDPASINLAVSRLRRKLTHSLPHVQIDTISRYGYQLSVVIA